MSAQYRFTEDHSKTYTKKVGKDRAAILVEEHPLRATAASPVRWPEAHSTHRGASLMGPKLPIGNTGLGCWIEVGSKLWQAEETKISRYFSYT
jgi:hypothetical protein